MRKFAFAVSLCLAFAFLLATFDGRGQSRARRATAAPSPAPTPSADDDQNPPEQTEAPPARSQQNDSSANSNEGDAQDANAPTLKGVGNDKGRKASTETTKNSPQEVGEDEVVRVSTTLVTLPVAVQDRDGRYIPDLRKENFKVYENGVEQQVAYFAATEKPFTVVLLIDTSGSTRFKIEEIQDAAIAFVNQLRQDDRVMVISFDDKIRVLTEATNDRYALTSAIRSTRVGGGTRFYDAIDFVIHQKLNQIEGRKAIVLFTDGVDTTSRRANYEGTLRDAEEADALVYSLEYDTYEDMNNGGYGGGGYPRGGGNYPGGGGGYPPSGGGGGIGGVLGSIILGSPYPGGGYPRRGGRFPGGGGAGSSREDYDRADQYLHEIAERTGGRFESAENIGDINRAFSVIAEELRRQYSIGYYPKIQPQPGERRQIHVRVDRPNLIARTRENYVFGDPKNAPQNASTTAQGNGQQPQIKNANGNGSQANKRTLPPYIF